MKKKGIILVITSGLLISSVALAAPPIENFDLGKGEVDIGTSAIPAMNVQNNYSYNRSDNVKHKGFGGAAVGLGHNLAFQFRYDENQMEPATKLNIRNQQYNLIYKINKNVNVYAGELHSRLLETNNGANNDFSTSRNIAQVGAQYHQKIARNATGWAEVAFGKDMQHYEIGTAYALHKNIDFDLSYQYTKVTDYTNSDNNNWKGKATSKGLYAGLQFKF